MKKQCIVLVSIFSLVGCAGQKPNPNSNLTVESNSSILTNSKEINGSKSINEVNQNVINKDVNITQNKIKEIESLFKMASQLSTDGNHTKALNKCKEALQKIEKKDTANLKKAKTCISKENNSRQEMLKAEKNARIAKMFDEANKLSGLKALSKYDEIIQLTKDKIIIKKAFIKKKNIVDSLDFNDLKLANFYFDYAQHTSFYEYFKKSGDLYYNYGDMTDKEERNKALKSYLEFYKKIQNDDVVLYRLGYLYIMNENWKNAKRFISEAKTLGNYDAKELWINKKLYSK